MTSPLSLLKQTSHRPWPLPDRPYLIHQSWLDLLFAHWPIPAAQLERLIPAGLTLDSFDGTGWLGIVPFRMANIHLRGLPPVPFTSAFPELNVRTYVTRNGKPGVYFFSLDAQHRAAVEGARLLYHLPYLYAEIQVQQEQGGFLTYDSMRRDSRGNPARLVARYGPVTDVYRAEEGTLEHWLTERYCLYSVDKRGDIYRGNIQHVPWPLQRAQADITINTMAACHGLELPETAPYLHYAKRLDVLVWGLERA
jgi:uncharacterized protein YqjF (DUF2071 family)